MARCRWQGVVPHVASFSRWNLRQIGIGHEFQRAVLANECGGEIVKSHASPTKGAAWNLLEYWARAAVFGRLTPDFGEVAAVSQDLTTVVVPGDPLSGEFRCDRPTTVGKPGGKLGKLHSHSRPLFCEDIPSIRWPRRRSQDHRRTLRCLRHRTGLFPAPG